MRRICPLKFPTLVVLGFVLVGSSFFAPTKAGAAIDTPSPDIQEPLPSDRGDGPADPGGDAMRKRTLDIVPVPYSPTRQSEAWPSEYFHRYRKGLTLRAGGYSGTNENGPGRGALAGVIYSFRAPLGDLDIGADLRSNNEGVLHVARRFIYSQDRFRPFIKFGGGVRVIPEEQLVTFLRLPNYQLRVGAGFEQLIHHAQSLRLDIEGSLATESREVAASLGYVWAW